MQDLKHGMRHMRHGWLEYNHVPQDKAHYLFSIAILNLRVAFSIVISMLGKNAKQL